MSPQFEYLKDVAENVTRLRVEKGWPEYVLANRAGVSVTTIRRVERARTPLRVTTGIKIANALGTTWVALQRPHRPKRFRRLRRAFGGIIATWRVVRTLRWFRTGKRSAP